MKRFGQPHVIVTDLLRSYGAAMKVIGNADRQETGRWLNNRAENSRPRPDSGLLANHEKGPFRRRERAMLRFRRMRSLQKIRLRRRLNSQSFQPRTSPLFTCQFQAQPGRRSQRVAPTQIGIKGSFIALGETGSHLSDGTLAPLFGSAVQLSL